MTILLKYILILMFFLGMHSVLYSQIYFQDRASVLGLNLSNGNTYLGNGVSFFDYNQDGWDDITLATGADDKVRFFKNVFGSFFEEFLLDAPAYQTKQINWVDFDNDGDYDLFVTSDTNGNRLYQNDGNFNFIDITETVGLPTQNLFTYGASWGDYNNDGFLDVFICNRDEYNLETPNFLFRNNGDGSFTDVSIEAGIKTTSEMSFCAAFFDFDNDGFQDIYVSNDKTSFRNTLYKNNGNGAYTDVSEISGTDIGIDAMSVTIDDFNYDGWMDIYITNGTEGNVFFQNNADGTFTDIAEATGTLFNSIGWGAVFFDAENDTDLDLYVSGNYIPNPIYLSSAFYENNGQGIFNIPSNSGLGNDTGESFSNAIGDFNNDGLSDIVVTNGNNETIFLWQNQTTTANKWLKVALEGTQSNRDGIGSLIEISVNGNIQYRYTLCGEGYLSQNSGTEIFGVGTASTIDYVKVNWLSGIEDIVYNVSPNQKLNIVEGSTLSVNQLNNNFWLNYNNPVDNTLKLSSTNEINNIQFYNYLGQEVYKNSKINARQFEVDLHFLNSGIYIVVLDFVLLKETIKIVKN